MSAENVEEFIRVARDDESVKSALLKANSPDDIVLLANEKGYEFSTEELSEVNVRLSRDDVTRISVRRAGFRVHPYGTKHWFGWK